MTVELLFDIETNGLLRELDRIHCIGIIDLNTGERSRFRRNALEDTIEDGLDMLAEADLLVGHNIVPFDLRAIQKVYPWWQPKEGQKWRDTLVMSQLIFSDQREKDFKLWKKGKLPGGMIGKHGLEAWGHRSGTVLKGDYAKKMKAEGRDPWAEWNPDMEDYMMNDLEVNVYLWNMLCETIDAADYPEEPIVLEHEVQDYLAEQEVQGIYFDAEKARALQQEWQEHVDRLSAAATAHYGSWWAPAKKRIVAPLWDDPGGKWREKAKSLPKPRPELGEDASRKVWAEAVIPSKTINYKDKPGRTEGAAFCPVELKKFNPQSRDQIVDRFVTVYNWEPNPDEENEWTDGGAPAVSDKILRALTHIPMAEELAEIFYYKKRLGMLADGKNAWLKKVTDKGLIHHRCNGGGTVSGRASHSDPNLGQTPKVKPGKLDRKQLDFAVQVVGSERVWSLYKKVDDDQWSGPLVGRKGKHGWECRDLFYVPEGWKLVGCDLSGIEFRCLANLTAPYDGGSLIHEVLEGDIHTANQKAAELDTRDQAKTFIYACVTLDAQALTIDGWRYYHELRVGDIVLTYNATKDVTEWQPIVGLVYYDTAPVVELSIGNFNVRTTPNHRWFCRRRIDRGSQGRAVETCVRTTEELSVEDMVITNASHVDNIDLPNGPLCSGLAKYQTDWINHVLRKQDIGHHPVWCLQTVNKSFVMRQGNTITITGNTMYGGGDVKLGSIKDPAASVEKQRKIGANLRATFMQRMPALAKAIKLIQKEARRKGYITGLDGRHLRVRSPHSALNLKLQSDAALIAKKWMILASEELVHERGWEPSWSGDFVPLLWVHDELQIAVRDEDGMPELVAELLVEKAAEAGRYFKFACPVDAKAKIGTRWSETH